MNEFEMFLFDSDVVLSLMCGLSYEEAIEEAKQIRRDEREWQRLTKHAPDMVESAASSNILTASEVSALEAESTPATTQVM